MNRLFICLLILALLPACALRRAELPASFLGEAVPELATEKTIEILPHTRWVNVIGGENIRFVIGDKAFGWAFNVASGVSSFDLRQVAPPGMLDRPVIAYVSPDPKYIGGDGNDRSD